MQQTIFEICERLAEAQALLHDHLECGRPPVADVVTRLQVLTAEVQVLHAMQELAFFHAKRADTEEYELFALGRVRLFENKLGKNWTLSGADL